MAGGYPKFVAQGLNDNYLPVWLQQAGYATYYTGKLMNAHSVHNWNNPFPNGFNHTNCISVRSYLLQACVLSSSQS